MKRAHTVTNKILLLTENLITVQLVNSNASQFQLSSIAVSDLWAPLGIESFQLHYDTTLDPILNPSLMENKSISNPSQLPSPQRYYSVPLLKSALQKATRLSKPETALRLAWQLICQDLTEFLRRLPIIMMEDSFMHPNLPLCIWIMMYQGKKKPIPRQLIQKLLMVVYDMASCKYRDPIPILESKNNNDNGQPYKIPLIVDDVSRIEFLPVISLLIRAEYGGMSGDVKMMQKFATSWTMRIKSQMTSPPWWSFQNVYDAIPECIVKQIGDMVQLSPTLEEVDKLLEGVDFHCFPSLLSTCQTQFRENGIKMEDIKRAVWFHRSGLSNKTLVCDGKRPMEELRMSQTEEEEKGRKETTKTWSKIASSWIKEAGIKFWKEEIPYGHQSGIMDQGKKTNTIQNYFVKKTM